MYIIAPPFTVILEFDVPSYRTAVAQNRQAEDVSHRQK